MNPNRLKWKWKDELIVPEYNISSPYRDDDIVWIVHNNYIQPFGICYTVYNIFINAQITFN